MKPLVLLLLLFLFRSSWSVTLNAGKTLHVDSLDVDSFSINGTKFDIAEFNLLRQRTFLIDQKLFANYNSCYSLLQDALALNVKPDSGVYKLRIDGVTADVYCDMDTEGGGWTYIARGSGTLTNYQLGSISSNPSAVSVWHMSANAIRSMLPESKDFLETYIYLSPETISVDIGYYRVRQEHVPFSFVAPMERYAAFDGTGYNTNSTQSCSPVDRGPCWEPDAANICCQRDPRKGEFTNCAQAPVNLEGQFSNDNLNQHLRCTADTTTRNAMVIFAR
eukprot:GCRY01001694.1.p1 GENE.GCRY01001694.1~~GCRY01001694.1.p1  ORF type:complete len:277 (+),score=31.59 GCRY01001694.1:122-952(+)